MDKYAIMFICALFTFLILMLCCVLNYKPIAAKPVTTEIPEYVAKCSNHETTRNTCIEFTIYRITRN